MSIPVITFFNNKGGVGKTSLVFHLAWMLSKLGKRVVAVDLDPQANLTAAFLREPELEALWEDADDGRGTTIFKCVRPLTEVGDIKEPVTVRINNRLRLIPGDLSLAGFEDFLSQEWPNSLGSGSLFRPFRILCAFWSIAQRAAAVHEADVILADVGPNLGAINRSALIGSDFVVIPLAADLFSLQGLKNLGPTLVGWRAEWRKRLDNWPSATFELPAGTMKPVGYVVHQHSVRLDRPVKAYQRWMERIPGIYRESVLQRPLGSLPVPDPDPECLATLKHYRSLIPMAQEANKPVFLLTPGEGAIGSHASAVQLAYQDFDKLARELLRRTGLPA